MAKNRLRKAEISRREFLKRASMALGGIALTPIVASSCAQAKTSATQPGGSTTAPQSTTGPAQSTAGTPSISSSTSNPPTASFVYTPPTTPPPTIPVPGTSCTIATDRKYSSDHIWVESVSGYVVIGITPSMVELLGEPHAISLVQNGTTLYQGDTFGNIEGFKMAADLITPISGIVTQVNDILMVQSSDFGQIEPINDDPFGQGWMLVVQPSQPAELNSLLTPQQYLSGLEN
jgi:glycine cleavage system H protein